MHYDYTVTLNNGEEHGSLTFKEAKSIAAANKDKNPVIDQFYKDDELTDVYWHYVGGKLKRVG